MRKLIVLILVLMIVALVAPLVHKAGDIIGIHVSPLIVAVVLLLLAWAVS